MATNIAAIAGPTTKDGQRGFPSPEALAELSEDDLRNYGKTGYRAPFLRELAMRVASGELDIERWRAPDKSSVELEDELRSVKGFGPYAAGNMLKLLGRYSSLALDSWVRGQFYKIHMGGRKVPDRRIERHYERFGEWRGLIFWLEMTRDWHPEIGS
jgi:3-methyladenine DNA glycosylase/8-oxoguanine DNA glycosylase